MKTVEKAAFQGEAGAFSQVAVHQLLGRKVEAAPCEWFDMIDQPGPLEIRLPFSVDGESVHLERAFSPRYQLHQERPE